MKRRGDYTELVHGAGYDVCTKSHSVSDCDIDTEFDAIGGAGDASEKFAG